MKKNTIYKNITIIFMIAALVLVILWRNGVIAKYDPAIITALLALITGFIDIFKKPTGQKLTGSGDNVGGNKINSPSHAGTGNIIGTMIHNHSYSKSEAEHGIQIKQPPITRKSSFDIKNYVDTKPENERNKFAEKYIGIKVEWDLLYDSISFPSENEAYIKTFPLKAYITDKKSKLQVFFNLNLNEFPEMRIAEKADRYLVTGTIIKYEYENNIFILELEKIEAKGKFSISVF